MNQETKGTLLTLLGGMSWGISGSIGQYLFQYQGMDSRWLVPIRLGLAGILMLAWYIFRNGIKKALAPWHTDPIELLIYGLIGVSACQFTYFLTIQLSTAGVATIMQDLSPITILLVTCILNKRMPRPLELLSIVLALSGVFLITTHGNLSSTAVPVCAIISGCISALAVTVYNMVPVHLMRKYPVFLMQGWAFLMGGCAASLIFHPWSYHYVPTLPGLAGIAGVVLIGNVLAFTAYMQGVKYIGAGKAILYGFSEPVTAAVISTVLLHSPFTIADGIGFAAIFLMLVLISISGKQRAGAKTAPATASASTSAPAQTSTIRK